MEMDWIASQPLFSQEMYAHKIARRKWLDTDGDIDLYLYIVQSMFTL